MAIQVKVEATPNPNAMKFTAARPLFEGRVIHKKGDCTDSRLVDQLISLEGVDNIFGYKDFITVNKVSDADWNNLLPQIEEIFNNL